MIGTRAADLLSKINNPTSSATELLPRVVVLECYITSYFAEMDLKPQGMNVTNEDRVKLISYISKVREYSSYISFFMTLALRFKARASADLAYAKYTYSARLRETQVSPSAQAGRTADDRKAIALSMAESSEHLQLDAEILLGRASSVVDMLSVVAKELEAARKDVSIFNTLVYQDIRLQS